MRPTPGRSTIKVDLRTDRLPVLSAERVYGRAGITATVGDTDLLLTDDRIPPDTP
jgi:hypothetical protein